jgi:hypothetical protein
MNSCVQLPTNWLNPECKGYADGSFVIDCEVVPFDSVIGSAVFAINAASIIASVVLVTWLVWNRNLPIVRVAQFVLCVIFIVGAMGLAGSAISMLGNNTDFTCMLRPWMFHFFFTFMFSPLFLKVSVLTRLLTCLLCSLGWKWIIYWAHPIYFVFKRRYGAHFASSKIRA